MFYSVESKYLLYEHKTELFPLLTIIPPIRAWRIILWMIHLFQTIRLHFYPTPACINEEEMAGFILCLLFYLITIFMLLIKKLIPSVTALWWQLKILLIFDVLWLVVVLCRVVYAFPDNIQNFLWAKIVNHFTIVDKRKYSSYYSSYIKLM